MKIKKYIWLPVAVTILSGVLYLTVDDPTYELDPRNVVKPLTESQRASWNQFTNAIIQAVATIDTEQFNNEITNYLCVANVPDLTQDSISILDPAPPISDTLKVARAICSRFELLVNEQSFSEAEELISGHIEIQRKLRDGARTLITYALAQANLKATYETLDKHTAKFPQDTKLRLVRIISDEHEVDISEILEREYALSMMPYFSKTKPRWMPKDTCNQYIKYMRTVTELHETNRPLKAENYQKKFEDKLLKSRSYTGSIYLSVVIPRPLTLLTHKEKVNRKKTELLKKLQNHH